MWVRDALHKRELTLCFHVCEISRTVINIRTVSPSGGEYRLRRSRRESPAAAAAKSLQSCPTLCDSRDGSPPVPVILQARTLEWVVISFSNAWKWKVKLVAQSCPTPSDPMDCSLPGSSVHGIFQARVLEWGAIAFSREPPRMLEIFCILSGDCTGVWIYTNSPSCKFNISSVHLKSQ